ncbi:MAG: DedA family protein [Bacteroidota bacterium]
MEFLNWALDLILRLDDHLLELTLQYGAWVYAILFLIIFCETGLVVTPFLPGDSLLFAVGSLTALGALDLTTVLLLLTGAAVLGDTANYWIGAYVGPKIFTEKHTRFLKREHLNRTHAFYEKYGGKTIVIARFVPIVRTFAPFVAGIGAMTYSKFFLYNVAGAVLWVFGLVLAGFWFGNLPIVKDNFSLVIGMIILISLLPGLVEWVRHRRAPRGPSEG